MYSAELEKHQKQSTEWRKKAESLEEKVVSLQVGWIMKSNCTKLSANSWLNFLFLTAVLSIAKNTSSCVIILSSLAGGGGGWGGWHWH